MSTECPQPTKKVTDRGLPAQPRSTSNEPDFRPYKVLSVDGHQMTVQCSLSLGRTLV